MSDRSKPIVLLEQQAALGSYLAALLQEVPDDVGDQEAAPAVAADPPPAVEPPARPTAGAGEPPRSGTEIMPPPWGRERFQCLLFKVAGLSLAVPLAKLNGVTPWAGGLTPMPNHSPLFLGLLRHQDRTVTVVDTALTVLPDGHRDRLLAPPAERLGHIILLDEGRWGLACDSLGEVLDLAPEDVRWRSAAGKRPWLAGTVLQHLCAVLDVDAFVGLLKTGADVPRQR